MAYEYDRRYQKVKPFLHSEAPTFGVEIIRVGLGVVKVLKKDELPPGKNKTYMGECVSQYDQTCNDQYIKRHRAHPPPDPEYADISHAETDAVVQVHDDIADQETAQYKEKTDLIHVWNKDMVRRQVICNEVKGVFLHDYQDAHRAHNVETECAPGSVKVYPENVYDAFQYKI